MSRPERLLALMQLLRRHRRPLAGAAIAAELGISLRTLYRDIASLQAQGAEIDGAPGLGYLMRPGFVLPPLMFSTDEVDALALGSRWVAERADSRLAAAARDALAKIAAVLPPALRHELDHSALLIGPGTASGPFDAEPLRLAIRHETPLAIRYRDAAGDESERRIWPFALGYFDRVQVVVAWCEMRAAMRHFRLDRITALEPLAGRYPRRRQALLAEWRAQQGAGE
jgi:predicted DNA-binding transcriptional regulator YafY